MGDPAGIGGELTIAAWRALHRTGPAFTVIDDPGRLAGIPVRSVATLAQAAAAFPDAVPTPYVMMAATDSRFFTAICPRVYRFTPFRMTRAQRESIHSYDEHVGVADWLAGS